MKRENWTDQKIIEGILEVVRNKNLDRMPSSSEVVNYYGNTKLSNAISKRTAWNKIAKELGLETKDSETKFGKTYEAKLMEKLICDGYEVENMPQNHPYDLLVENTVKIDVKASKLYCGDSGNFYSFNLEKRKHTCDIFVLYLIGSQSLIKDILVLPSEKVMNQSQISVGEKNSKYYQYSKKFEYIDKIIEFKRKLNN